MKPQFLIVLLSLLFFSCEKDDDNPAGAYAFDESVFGTYSTYFISVYRPMDNACSGLTTSTITPESDNVISFENKDLPFLSSEDGVYRFGYSTGISGYMTHYSLVYYSCADSIVYSHSPSQGYYSSRVHGKKIDGKDCSDSTPSDFEVKYCHQGPDNSYCYSSELKEVNVSLGTIYEFNYISVDTINQTIQVGMSERLEISLPTDSSLTLLTGMYRLGETPAEGEQSILKISIQEYYEWSVNTQDFEDGYLSVNQSGDTYTISFNFTCSGNAIWTGYYKGNIE